MRLSRPLLFALITSLLASGLLILAAGPLAVPGSAEAPVAPAAHAESGGDAGNGEARAARPASTATSTPTPGLDVGSARDAVCGAVVAGDTRLGQSNVNSYSCLNYTLPETGPEQVFRLTTSTTGTITASLTYDSRLYDVDIFILTAPSPDACVGGPPPGPIDPYDTITVLRDALPGLYYLVVDTFDNGQTVRPGPYTLSVSCPADPVQATATPTATPAVSPTPTRVSLAGETLYLSLMRKDIPPTPTPTFTPSPTPTLPPYAQGVNAGGTLAYPDGDGRVYAADQVYTPGAWGYDQGYPDRTDRAIAHNGTIPDEVFQTVRGTFIPPGNLTYRFDVPAGVYRVALLFAEVSDFAKPGLRQFNVYIEGQKVLDHFDAAAEAQRRYGGSGFRAALVIAPPDIPDIRVTDGALEIRFESVTTGYAAQVNALYVEKIAD